MSIPIRTFDFYRPRYTNYTRAEHKCFATGNAPTGHACPWYMSVAVAGKIQKSPGRDISVKGCLLSDVPTEECIYATGGSAVTQSLVPHMVSESSLHLLSLPNRVATDGTRNETWRSHVLAYENACLHTCPWWDRGGVRCRLGCAPWRWVGVVRGTWAFLGTSTQRVRRARLWPPSRVGRTCA